MPRLTLIAALLCLPLAALAAPAHEHGVARLDIVVEAARVTMRLEIPLDSLLGFERAPRSDAERRQVDTVLGQLRDGGQRFNIDPAAGCRFVHAVLSAPVLGAGPRRAAEPGEHAEVWVDYEFECRARAGHLAAQLFQPFVRLQRIDGQAVTPGAQRRFTLRRPAVRVELAP